MYNLPLQVSLQVNPAQLTAFRKQLETSLSGIRVGDFDSKNFAKVQAQLGNVTGSLNKGEKAAQSFFDRVEGKGRGFAAYTIASTAILKLSNILSQATREAIKFETELIKISQVTGENISRTKIYSRELIGISKTYNVALSKVAQLTRTLTQTGLSFREAAKGAAILARTDLLATFESLTSTTEGLIAVMQTFEVSVSRAGKVLESINSVSKQFAVESTDIVEAIRRTGGAFSTAGGQIEELIALFTSVRSTTRESAETIATGFRTIFGRLQRPKTIEYFKQLGIQLETAEGQFIGPFQAIERISAGLEKLGITAGTIKFAEVVEQIGGIRQISRVVPLLEQFNKSQRALKIANNASTDSIEDVEKAQKGLGFQLGQLQKEFGVLISDIINSPSFKFFAEVFINISKAVIGLTSSLKPLLPLLATVATFKIGRGISKLLSGGINLKGAKDAIGFASGGMVPGSGNGDTVPAMLTPGEFVIRKSAVQAYGADRLAKINKYAEGGLVSIKEVKGKPGADDIKKYQAINNKVNDTDEIRSNFKREVIGGTFNEQAGNFIPYEGFSSKLDWKKIVDSVAGYKGNVFTKWAEAFEEEIGKATGMSVTSQSRNDTSYPIDLEGAGKLAEVRMRLTQTAYETYLSKIFRAKIDQNSSDLNKFTKLAHQDPDKVDLHNFEVYETSPKGKEEFLKWASHLGHQAKAKKKNKAGTKLSPSLLETLRKYTSEKLNVKLNTKLFAGEKSENKTDYSNEISNLDALMTFDLPSVLYSGLESPNKHDVIKNKMKAVSPDPRNPDYALLKGETLNFSSYFSTSVDRAVAEFFSGGISSGGLMTIATKGKGVDVQKALASSGIPLSSLESAEKEFILPRSSKFKVLDISKSGKKYALDNYLLDVQQLANGGMIQKFAEGGGVGTDTVPAMVSNGEAFVPPETAKKIGHGKLKKMNQADSNGMSGFAGGGISVFKGPGSGTSDSIGPIGLPAGSFIIREKATKALNKYADGGFIGGMQIQRFKKGGTSKAARGISEERRKQLKEEALARQNAEAGGSGLTRAGRKEASETAGAKTEIDTIAIQEKWDAYVKEEIKNAKSFYQERLKSAEDPLKLLADGASIEEISKAMQEEAKIKEDYNKVIADIKQQAEQLRDMDVEKAAVSNQAESEAEVRTKEAEVSQQSAEAAMPSTKPVEEATKSLADKIKAGGATVYDSLSTLGVSYAEAAIQAQSIASGLANFAGLEINQEALTSGTVKGGQLSAASEAVAKAADPKKIQAFGSQLNKVGKMLPQSIGGPVRKFGGTLLKNADKIAKGAGMAAKALNVLSYIELAGGLFDSLLSQDYSKQRDNFIALGNAAGAAEAAQNAYAQEMLRSIPVIGGFLAGLGSYLNILPQNLDATGELVVANAKLEASINGTDREVNKAKKAFADASAIGDVQGQKDAINAQLAAVENLQMQSADVASKQGEAGASVMSGVTGAAGGALAGAAIGSFVPIIGTAVGAVAGAVIGGAYSLYSSSEKSKEAILKGYELQAEAAKKGAEVLTGVFQEFGSRLKAEASKQAALGGTYADTFKNVMESMGLNDRTLLQATGRKDLGQNATEDIDSLRKQSARLEANIEGSKGRLGDSNLTEIDRGKIEAQIAELEKNKQVIDTIRDGIVASENERIIRERVIRQQNIQNAAMNYQIKVMKHLQTAMDSFNESARNLANIEEEMDNIGTGKLTSRQATAQAGFDPKLYEKSADEIVRSNQDAMKIAADVGGIGGEEIAKGQQRVDAISRIKDLGLTEIVDAAKGSGEKASVEEVQDMITEKLKDQMGGAFDENDPVLKAAIAEYSASVSENVTNAAQAEEEARKKATAQSIEIIQQQQEKVKQIADAEKKLQNRKIEEINRQSALAQKVYDTEKEYFEKRMALNDKVEDFLNPIKEGPGKAGAILARGNARADRDRGAMLDRRNAGLASVGLGGFKGNLGGAVGNVAGRAAGAEGLEIAQVQSQIDMLAKTIQDEIGIEEQRLNTLMESAKAQQEYTQSLNDAQGDLVRGLVTGTEEEIADQLNTMNAAAMAAQQGSFAGIPEEMKKGVFALFDQFGDVEIPGLGMTGRDAQRNITKNELMRNFGYDEATAEKLASKAVKDKVPIDEKMAEQIEIQKQKLLELYEYEKKLKDAQNAMEAKNNQTFANAVKEFAAEVENMKQKAAPAAAPPAAAPPAGGAGGGAGAAGAGAGAAGAGAAGAGAGAGAAGAGGSAGRAGGAYTRGNAGPELWQDDSGADPFASTPGQVNQDALSVNASDRQGLEMAEKFGTIGTQDKTRLEALRQVENPGNVVRESDRQGLEMAEKFGTIGTQDRSRLEALRQVDNMPSSSPPAMAGTGGTGGGRAGSSEPIQVQTQGQQEITVRLPDIQALVNQSITSSIYDTVAGVFKNLANEVRTANNFEDVANAFEGGIEQTETKNTGGAVA